MPKFFLISMVAALTTISTLSVASTVLPVEPTDVEQMQKSAKDEAIKTLIEVSPPTYGKNNRAVVRVESGQRYCLVLMNKLMVAGANKGVWTPEKTECH